MFASSRLGSVLAAAVSCGTVGTASAQTTSESINVMPSAELSERLNRSFVRARGEFDKGSKENTLTVFELTATYLRTLADKDFIQVVLSDRPQETNNSLEFQHLAAILLNKYSQDKYTCEVMSAPVSKTPSGKNIYAISCVFAKATPT